MNKPKLFVDEDACEEAVVSALRRQGIDVLTVLDVVRAGIDDDEQLRFATSLGRAIYSLNARHFAPPSRVSLAGRRTLGHHRYSASTIQHWRENTQTASLP